MEYQLLYLYEVEADAIHNGSPVKLNAVVFSPVNSIEKPETAKADVLTTLRKEYDITGLKEIKITLLTQRPDRKSYITGISRGG